MEDGSLERELQCAICTDILYQPLTLLDCLHTFCGSCLKEWFAFQSTAAAANTNSPSRSKRTFTCPSCRDPVRGTKVDWRANTLLEGFLKANPGRGKTEKEKEEMRRMYTPGEDVLVENIAAVANAGRTSRRVESVRVRREEGLEHQPSLRSLLGDGGEDDGEVQAEILRQINAEGWLDGVDLENMTREEEEELTDRIAEAYRRRRVRGREREGGERREGVESRDGGERRVLSGERRQQQQQEQGDQSQTTRSRPPISRPHLFEQGLREPVRNERRSASSSSHRANLSTPRQDAGASPAARSATDLSPPQSTRHGRAASTGRSVTDPAGTREQVQRVRAISSQSRHTTESGATVQQQQQQQSTNSAPPQSPRTIPPYGSSPSQPSVRPAPSLAAFAPEALPSSAAPSITCSRCNTPNIQSKLHYHCPSTLCSPSGSFNLCLRCYRAEKGCNNWFGHGYRAMERWQRNKPAEGWVHGQELPHVLQSRRYREITETGRVEIVMEDGPFCESCLEPAATCYWYCTGACLDGAWGFCDTCVQQGRHCTHPLLLTTQPPPHPTSKDPSLTLPHLPTHPSTLIPPTTHCDLCHRSLPAPENRYHCYHCSAGDYDICHPCYSTLVSQSRIPAPDGPDGWRRCPQSHRMALIAYQPLPNGGFLRQTLSGIVGGFALQDDENGRRKAVAAAGGRMPGEGKGLLARWSYFPAEGVEDELAFPKNAVVGEVREVGNEDWVLGVYAGREGLVSRNYLGGL